MILLLFRIVQAVHHYLPRIFIYISSHVNKNWTNVKYCRHRTRREVEEGKGCLSGAPPLSKSHKQTKNHLLSRKKDGNPTGWILMLSPHYRRFKYLSISIFNHCHIEWLNILFMILSVTTVESGLNRRELLL